MTGKVNIECSQVPHKDGCNHDIAQRFSSEPDNNRGLEVSEIDEFGSLSDLERGDNRSN